MRLYRNNYTTSYAYIEDIKEKVDLVQLINEDIDLTPKGNEYVGWDSRHDSDSKTSLKVSPEVGLWHCFNCGEGGDCFSWLMNYRGFSFHEALRLLASQTGISLLEIPDRERLQIETIYKDRREIYPILTAAGEFYHSQLVENHFAAMAKHWGLTRDTVKKYKIGYAPNSGKALKNYLLNQGWSQDLLAKTGLFWLNERHQLYDFFSGRLIIPYWSNNQVVYFIGRWFHGCPDERAKSKYKKQLTHRVSQDYVSQAIDNSWFFGEDSVRGVKELLITEGVADCLAAMQAGFSSISPATTGFRSADYNKILKFAKRAERVYICNDNEDSQAGEKGSIKTAEFLESHGVRVGLITLPKPENATKVDLAEFLINHTAADLKQLFKISRSYWEIKANRLIVPNNCVEAARVVGDFVVNELADCDDLTAGTIISKVLKEKFSLDSAAVKDILKARHKAFVVEKAKPISNDKEPEPLAVFPGLVDIVVDNEKPAFLLGNTMDTMETMDTFTPMVTTTAEYDGKSVVPPDKAAMPWLLPRASEVLRWWDKDSDSKLFESLVDYHKSISDLPEEAHYYLLATFDMATYLQEKLQYLPIIVFEGLPERGKSRTGKGIIYVAYRGVHETTVRDTHLIRYCAEFGASLFLDTMDFWKKVEKTGSEDAILGRFERGHNVRRVLYPERGLYRDSKYYPVFGPTLVATNRSIDHILETRALIINLPEASRVFNNDIRPEDVVSYRERLVAFRARNMNSILPSVDKPCAGRLGDITRPLIQVIKMACPEKESLLIELIQNFHRLRLIEKADSFAALVYKTFLACEPDVNNGVLPVSVVVEEFNKARQEDKKITPQRIGKTLSSIGLQKATKHGGVSAYLWPTDEQKNNIARGFGLAEIMSPSTPLSPSPPDVNESKPDGGYHGELGDHGDICKSHQDDDANRSWEGDLDEIPI
ncbi:MAG: hypothetical protein JL56_04595 [Desulfotomaculum sp. BICA1-6]|nr:MAG: hypothetical protein JL56_04595 [Desulfotomaculum sp. BICA1-6]